MEQREGTRNERETVRSASAEDSFPWAEWAIIEDTDDGAESSVAVSWENIYDGASSCQRSCTDDEEETSDAEEAQERTDRISEQAGESGCGESLDRQNEESDGVSVISESDNEDRGGVNDPGSRIVVYAAASCRSEERNTSKEVVTGRACLLIGCCVLVAIGAGFGSRSYGFGIFSKDGDSALPKEESQKLSDCAKELSSELIQEDMESSALEKKTIDATEVTRNEQEHCVKGLHDSYPRKPKILLESTIHDPEATLLERLQNYLRVICLVLKDDVVRTDKVEPICGDSEPRSFFEDLANLKTLLNGAIEEMGEPIESANRRFLGKMDLRIASMGDSFVSDLFGALEKLRLRSEKKLEKIARGMKERLCVLRNTLPSDSEIRRSLEADETSLLNCNATTSKKFEGKAEKRSETPISLQYESAWHRPNRHFNPKRRNFTKSFQRPTEYGGSARRSANKCGSDEQTDSVLGSRGNSCSQLPVANQKAENKEHVAPRASKKKAEHEDRTNRKRNNSASNEKKKKYTKKSASPEVRARTVPTESFDRNANVDRDERSYPIKSPTQQPAREWFDEAINIETREDDTRANGQWQFARSRVRDRLRKDESTDNWYFDRVRSRKNSRLNDDIEHER